MFSQIKDRKHIENYFHSVAKVMPRDGIGGLGESKTLVWGFVMAPHRLRALVFLALQPKHMLWVSNNSLNEMVLLSTQNIC